MTKILVPYTGTIGSPHMSYYQPDEIELYDTFDLREHANEVIIKLERKITTLDNMLRYSNKNITELLEYSQMDKDVDHVWTNAEECMYKVLKYLNN